MKLRYYLRGLGIGVIVTALIMGVALKDDKSLSDAEIRARAAELGMVEEGSRTLAQFQSEQGNAATPSVSPTDSSTPTPSPSATPKPTESADPTPTATLIPTLTPSSEAEESENIIFMISSGQSSYTVSRNLADVGLIENADDFDRYLENNGYSKRISTGIYEIPVEATQEEIAKIITKSM